MTEVDREEAVMRYLRGEQLIPLANELGIETSSLEEWASRFVAAGRQELQSEQATRLSSHTIRSREDSIGRGIHPDSFVWWDHVRWEDLDAFVAALDTAAREEDIQKYLTAHPLMLVQPLGGGHGRWVIPKLRFAEKHVTDYVIGDRDSAGYHWTLVELESPRAALFTSTGDESAGLRHAIRQVEDWRAWISDHGEYARSETGTCLPDITPTAPAWVIIGRRSDERPPGFDARRRQWQEQHGIRVHSFDWLVDKARGRLIALNRPRLPGDQALDLRIAPPVLDGNGS